MAGNLVEAISLHRQVHSDRGPVEVRDNHGAIGSIARRRGRTPGLTAGFPAVAGNQRIKDGGTRSGRRAEGDAPPDRHGAKTGCDPRTLFLSKGFQTRPVNQTTRSHITSYTII